MPHGVHAVVLLFTLFGACQRLSAQHESLPTVSPPAKIELDATLYRALTSPDAELIKSLHDQSEKPLLDNLGIKTDQQGLAVSRFQRKRLVLRREYDLHGQRRRVFVYDPCLHRWPGTHPETIIICNASYKLLQWKEVGGSPALESAALDTSADSGPILSLTCRHRHIVPNPERGIYKFSLADDKIQPLAKVEWLYENDAERAQYDLWRKAIREHQSKRAVKADFQAKPSP